MKRTAFLIQTLVAASGMQLQACSNTTFSAPAAQAKKEGGTSPAASPLPDDHATQTVTAGDRDKDGAGATGDGGGKDGKGTPPKDGNGTPNKDGVEGLPMPPKSPPAPGTPPLPPPDTGLDPKINPPAKPGAAPPVATSCSGITADFSPVAGQAPLVITSEADLAAVRGGSHYRLDRDIELSPQFTPIPATYQIVLDGEHHTIKHLHVASTGNDAGLFSQLYCSHVRDLTLTDVSVAGQADVGALAGAASMGTLIEGVAVNGGTVRAHANGGGVVGRLELNSRILATTSNADVLGTPAGSALVLGGLVGNVTSGSSVAGSSASGEVQGGSHLGGLIGVLANAAVSKVSASGQVVGVTALGGLIGTAQDSTVEDSSSTSAVSGLSSVGGLVGWSLIQDKPTTGTITRSSHTIGTVEASNAVVGGLVGAAGPGGGIYQSFAKGAVVSGAGGPGGGLVGWLGGGDILTTLADSYALVDVSHAVGVGTPFLGGLVGMIQAASIVKNSFASGKVQAGDYSGGLIGAPGTGAGTPTTTSSYWDVDTSTLATSLHGTGVSSAQMHVPATFVGWDCSKIWVCPTDAAFPRLMWEK